MVVDMKLHKNKTSVGSGKPLEVDLFPFGYADEPRENPGAMEGMLCPVSYTHLTLPTKA